jgi:iron complex transport system substrate-binding protein
MVDGRWRSVVAALAVTLALPGLAPVGRRSQNPTAARIVSTSPSITETLFALGLGDRVVGVSQYCRFPAEVQRLPKVGTFLHPDPERIVALRPDLVFVHQVAGDLAARLATMRVRAVPVSEGTLDGVFEAIGQIADGAGVHARGQSLIANIRAKLDQIRVAARTQPVRSVIFIIGRRPGTLSDLVAVGPGSYLDALLGIAGGRNALASPGLPEYPRISMETVLRLDPDVIIDTVDMGDTADERRARQPINRGLWQAYQNLRAVQTGHLYADTTDALVVPGPRVVDAAAWLAALIHPR